MKKLKKFTTLLMISLAISLFTPQIPEISTGTIEVNAATIKLNKKKATLIKGNTLTLKVSGKKKKVSWKSSNKKVATISSKGKVSAKKKGTTTITAKVGKKKLKCKITVEAPSINKKSITMKKGEATTLKINGTKQKVSWKSSDKNVVSINSKGKVTAKSYGVATITGNISGKKFTCKVTVKREKAPSNQATSEKKYKIGETWTIPGQWKITIDSVKETDYRNEYSDLSPEAVYMIDFTYENIGYVDKSGFMNGLFIDFSLSTIIDSKGYAGYSYPGDILYYAKEIPVGAKCKAQSCIGVSHKGDFKLYYDTYDGNNIERKAIFDISTK